MFHFFYFIEYSFYFISYFFYFIEDFIIFSAPQFCFGSPKKMKTTPGTLAADLLSQMISSFLSYIKC